MSVSVERRRIPEEYREILTRFFDGYRSALRASGLPGDAHEHLFETYLDLVEAQLREPHAFEPFHRQVTSPFDCYTFGLEFLRPLVDKSRSSVLGLEYLAAVAASLRAGDNVVFLANHQTEADPQAISLLLEDSYPAIGKEMIFVAGHRVLTDPLAAALSVGRNLLCIHSKRHIEHPPEQKTAKQAHNQRTMARMAELLSDGGRCIYVAPSGGRDRTNAQGEVEVARFDAQSIELFHLMARRAARPTHFHPMALATYHLLPPPEAVEVHIGEARRTTRCGLHLAVGAEIDMGRAGGDAADRQARRDARALYAWERVRDDYQRLVGSSGR